MEIAVIGDDLFTIGFRLVGIEKWFNISGDVSVDEVVKSALSDKGIGVIVIHDKNWKELEPSLRKKLSTRVKPTVIAIGSEVDQGLRDRIKSAVVVDLWK